MPEPTLLDNLREIATTIRNAESQGAERQVLLSLWRQRRHLVQAALDDERRPSDIARALDISRERIRQLASP